MVEHQGPARTPRCGRPPARLPAHAPLRASPLRVRRRGAPLHRGLRAPGLRHALAPARAVEEAFDARWEHWLDNAGDWTGFFEKLESLSGSDLTEILRAFELVEGRDLEAYGKLRRSAEGRAVPLPGIFSGTDADVALLALGFARGEPSALAVPYARRAEA